jgi:hypothetical protein
MNTAIKTGAIALLVAASIGLGGCVYYPVRTGVTYNDPAADGNAIVDYDDSAPYYAPYAPAYYGYYDPYWYGPGWYGYGWPAAVSFGFYGGYWGGGSYWGGRHSYHGPWRGGGWGGRGGASTHITAPSSHGGTHHH